MKKEDLYEGLGALNDDVLKRSEKEEGTMKKRNMSKILKIGSLAACLIVALGVGVFFIGGNKTPEVENNAGEESNIVTSTNVAESIDAASSGKVVSEELLLSMLQWKTTM